MGNTGSAVSDRIGELDDRIIAGCLQHIHLRDVPKARLICRRACSVELHSFLDKVFQASFDEAELHRLLVVKFCKACSAKGPAVSWPANVLTMLLQIGVPVDRADRNGHPPLYVAAHHGRTPTVRELLAAGAAVDLTQTNTTFGSSPLLIAVDNGHMDTVAVLLAAGAAVDTVDKYGRTPLWVAAHKGNTAAVLALLAAGASTDLHGGDLSDQSPLYIAAMEGHTDTIAALLAADADIEAESDDGRTCLWVAARAGRTDAVAALLAAGADVDAADHREGMSALDVAAFAGHTGTVATLLAACNHDLRDEYRMMEIAVIRGHTAIVDVLRAAAAQQ